MKLLTVCGATLGSTNVIVKSPRDVCTVAVYFLAGSMTVGGGVVRCSMQVTISLSQPGAVEVGPAESAHAHTAMAAIRPANMRFITSEFTESARRLARAQCNHERQQHREPGGDRQRVPHVARRRDPTSDQRAEKEPEGDCAGVEPEDSALRFHWGLQPDHRRGPGHYSTVQEPGCSDRNHHRDRVGRHHEDGDRDGEQHGRDRQRVYITDPARDRRVTDGRDAVGQAGDAERYAGNSRRGATDHLDQPEDEALPSLALLITVTRPWAPIKTASEGSA